MKSHKDTAGQVRRFFCVTVNISYFSTVEQPRSIKYLFYLLSSYQLKRKKNIFVVAFQTLIVFQKYNT